MQRFIALLCCCLLANGIMAQPLLKNEKLNWIDFQWNDPKDKDAIFLKSRLDTLDYNFNWQLDTGSPYTFINGATWNIFNKRYTLLTSFIRRVDTVQMGNYYKVAAPPFLFYGKQFLADTLLKNDKMGGGFPDEYVDKYRGYGFQMGTVGLDMFRNKVLVLNFKESKVGWGNALPDTFYKSSANTSSFIFYKNRIIVPVQIGNKQYPFMYDCGASMFTLQTTPKNSVAFKPAAFTDTLFGINNGETGTVHNVPGGKLTKPVTIAGKTYKDLIVYVEAGESGIFDEAKVAGIIGNKLFLDRIVIIDFIQRKFTVLE